MFDEMLVKYVLERMHGFQKILLFATTKSKRHFPSWSIFIPKWIVLWQCRCKHVFRGATEQDNFFAVVCPRISEEYLKRTSSLPNHFWGSNWKEQGRCKIIFGGVLEKNSFVPMFWRFLQTTMSLKDRIWRSNRNGQYRWKRLFQEIGGFSEKDQFVAKSCLKEPLTTSLWQSHWWRSSVKRNVVVKWF